jgi:hypothetical protein
MRILRRFTGPFAGLLAVVVATLWVAPLASAQPTLTRVTAAPASISRLQLLVNATATQFKVAYRHHAAEQRQRREQLAAAIAAWRAAARSEVNNDRLAGWLRGAIRASMPGAREPLPPLPEFDRQPVVAAAPPRAPLLKPATTAEKPVAPVVAPVDAPIVAPSAVKRVAKTVAEAAPIPPTPSESKTEDVDIFAPPSEAPIDTSTAPEPSPELSPEPSSTEGQSDAGDWDFWSGHPGDEELPADLTDEDPFRDDPAAN